LAYAGLIATTSAAHQELIALLCMVLIVVFRAVAIRWKLEVPDWFRLSDTQSHG